MPSYYKVNGALADYKDDLGDGYADGGEDKYADAEEDEYHNEEEEEEQLSEEALKLLKYRQKLKEQLRSKLRKENGISGNNLTDESSLPVLKKFGSFFGPSKPVIADRVIQETKALLDTPRLAPKSSTFGDPKQVSNSGAGSNKETCGQPLNQVKTKAQILKDIRDYSFLLSDDKDTPKLTKDPKEQNSLVPCQDKIHEPLAHSGRLVSNSHERKKTLELNTHPAPPRKACLSIETSIVSLNLKRQLDSATQRQPIKQSGNGPVRPALFKSLPMKKPLYSDGKKVPNSLEKKHCGGSVKNEISPVLKNIISNGQKSLLNSRASCVSNNLELKKDPQRRSESNLIKKEIAGACTDQRKLPKRCSIQANLENNLIKNQKVDRQNVNKYSGGVNKDHYKKERRAEKAFSDDECDYRSIIRNMFGYRPSRYEDVDDDDDDMCMEADFATIQREESRSAKIAKKEDEVELAKILEEERQERLRKKAKMCKVR